MGKITTGAEAPIPAVAKTDFFVQGLKTYCSKGQNYLNKEMQYFKHK